LLGSIAGGATGGVLQTQGGGINGTTLQAVTNPADCTVANGADTTATGLCASAGTRAGVNGATTTTVATGATAYGSQSVAQDKNTTAIGFRATATYEGSVAIGYQARAIADPATAVGWNSLASGNDSVALGAAAEATANRSVALGAYSVADQPNTVSVGSPGNERRITNVAAGVAPTDAVNVSQLRAMQQQVGEVSRIAYSGIAMAAALAGMPQVDVNKKFNLSLGVGNYAGYSALAIGGSARINQDTVMKFGISSSSGRFLVNVGVGFSW
jgi:autotransporter adhesin